MLLPLYAGIFFSAVEVLIVVPVLVPEAAESTTLEVLLYKVDNILEVKVVPVALDQLLGQLLLEELSQFVRVDEAQRYDRHLSQEEEEETEGVKPAKNYNDPERKKYPNSPQETHVLSQSSDTSRKADNEDYDPDEKQEKADIEYHIENCVELKSLPARPLIHDGVDTDLRTKLWSKDQHLPSGETYSNQ